MSWYRKMFAMIENHNMTWWDIGHGGVTNGDNEMLDSRKDQNEWLWVMMRDGRFDFKPKLLEEAGYSSGPGEKPVDRFTEHDTSWMDDMVVGNNVSAYGRVNVGDGKASVRFVGLDSKNPQDAKKIEFQGRKIERALSQQFGPLATYLFR